MTSLKDIRIQRFKTIADAPFDLGRISLLVGANNAGKSTIIQALHFAVGVLQTIGLSGQWPAKESGDYTTSLNPVQLVYSPTEDVYALGHGGRLQEPKEHAISVTITLDDGRQCEISIRRGRNRNVSVWVDNVGVAKELSSLAEPFSIFSPGLAGITKAENYVSDGVLLRTIARGDANLVLRNTLLRLWNTDKWQPFLDDLREIFPEIDFSVKFEQSTDEHISVAVKSGSSYVPLELAGTGILQATQILSYVHRYNPSILVLDEPDSHLHPNNQRLLCALLHALAEDRSTQVLLTTHSRHVVDAIGSTAKFLWVRQSGVEVASSDDEIGILLDIGALDVKERVANSSSKAIVLTEDERTRGLQCILAASGFNMEQTAILSYFGCTNTKNLQPLLRIVQANNPQAKLIVHRDRDYFTDEESTKWKEGIRKLNVEPFLTAGVDVESHFLQPQVLAAINNDVSVEDFEDLLGDAFEDTQEANIEKYINGRTDLIRKSGALGTLNPGKLASEATKAVSENPETYAHGKAVLKRLRALFREKLGRELQVYVDTRHLMASELNVIAKKVFKQKQNGA